MHEHVFYTLPREGVIIECPLKWQFHDLVTVILTSRTAVSRVVENVDNVVNVILGKNIVEKTSFFGKMTITNVFSHKIVRSRHFSKKWRFWVIKPLEVVIFPKNNGYFFSIYT